MLVVLRIPQKKNCRKKNIFTSLMEPVESKTKRTSDGQYEETSELGTVVYVVVSIGFIIYCPFKLAK